MINDPFQMQRELRYGAPVCDQVLTGRHFTIGYSWYFRQAKWVLEIINPLKRDLSEKDQQLVSRTKIERMDNFRADTRVPPEFRASLTAYTGSGYDRGHLVASANHDLKTINNSETFLLSNMAPQSPELNRKIWARLEKEIRRLDDQLDTLETYVLTCPVYYFDRAVTTIGSPNDPYGVSIPVPHAFIKSVLIEDSKGRLLLWTFKMDNAKLLGPVANYLIDTHAAERLVGGVFWDRVHRDDLYAQKRQSNPMW